MPKKFNPKNVTEFTVLRKNWWRGKGTKSSALRKTNDKQCCLGFYCRATGVKAKDIVNVKLPENLLKNKGFRIDNPPPFKNLVEVNIYKGVNIWQGTALCNEIAITNDNPNIMEKTREKILIKLFKTAGISVKFI